MPNILKVNLGNNNELEELLIKKYNQWAQVSNLNQSSKILLRNSIDGYSSFYYQDIENINKVKNSIVFINCATEGIHSQDCFKQYEKSNFYIIFSNGVWSQEHYKFGIDYVNLTHYLFLTDMLDGSVSLYKELSYNNKNYKFDYPKANIFVSTIGGKRYTRDFLVENLTNQLKFKNYILKYAGLNFGKNYDHLDFYHQSDSVFDAYCPIDQVNQLSLSISIPTELYNQAYFNLVVETDVDHLHSFFPTEKIAKVLITGIPFVVYSTPHFLKNLQELGFTTYNSLWDESYDLEFDYKKRAAMITDLCNHLHTFNWNKNKTKLIDIANKNAANLLRNNSIIVKQFEQMHNTFEIIKKHNIDYLKINHPFEESTLC